jgi:hypothetical protein
MTGSPPIWRNFDLTAVEAVDRVRSSSTKRLIVGFLLLFIVIGAVVFAFNVPKLTRDWGTLVSSTRGLEAIGLFGAFVAYELVTVYALWLTLSHGGRGPVRAEVREAGFSLVWADGCRREFAWGALRGRLRMDDLSVDENVAPAQIQLSAIGFGVLTRDACAAIEESARHYGMRVDVAEYPRTGVAFAKRSITVRPPARGASSFSPG